MKKFHILTAGVFVLLVSGVFISNGFAGLVSSGSETLSANNGATTSFVIQVDYELHDIGGGQYEARFQLEHLGAADEGDTVAKIGRFSIHTENPGENLPYVGDPGTINDASLVAPSFIEPRSWWNDRAVYWFDTDDPDYIPTFADGDVSEWLILTFNAADMPQENIVIEIDETLPYGMDADAFITLAVPVPEPATLILLAGGAVLLRRRKR